MHFPKAIGLLLGAASLNTMAQSLSPGENVILALDAITCASQTNLEVANNITKENVLEQGKVLVENFSGIVKKVSGSLSNITSLRVAAEQNENEVGSPVVRASHEVRQFGGGIPSVDQHAICNSFRFFVLVHQQLLSIVIGQKGLLATTPYTSPLGVVLRSLEGAVDTFAFAVINLVPGCAAHATQLNGYLGPTLSEAAVTYP